MELSLSFIAAQYTPMGWGEGEFIMDLQVYFFSILESVIESLLIEN